MVGFEPAGDFQFPYPFIINAQWEYPSICPAPAAEAAFIIFEIIFSSSGQNTKNFNFIQILYQRNDFLGGRSEVGLQDNFKRR